MTFDIKPHIRTDVFKPADVLDWGSHLHTVAIHFQVYSAAVEFLGPWNSRQRANTMPYQAPSRDILRGSIKQGGMNDLSYSAFITSLEKWCLSTKGMKALVTPHPSIIHSVQLPQGAFSFEYSTTKINTSGGTYTSGYYLHVPNSNTPLFVPRLKDASSLKFIIIRPKLATLGTPSASRWEILGWKTNFGYIPNWVDSDKDPRYSGRLI